MVARTDPTIKTHPQIESEPQVECQLGRPLGNCPLRRKAGCGSLFDAMMYVLPPFSVRLLVRDQMQGDRAAQDWLQCLNDVLPEQRPMLRGRREW